MLSTMEAASYGLETLAYAQEYRDEVVDGLGIEYFAHRTALKKTGALASASFGVVGVSAFDMLTIPKPEMRQYRGRARHLVAATLHFSDLANDIIHETEFPLTGEEKQAVLQSLVGAVLDGEVPTEPHKTEFDAAVSLGRYVSGYLGDVPSFRTSFRNYPDIESRFDGSANFDKVLQYVRDLGGCVGNVTVSASELILNDTFPRVAAAYQELGRYGLILDHAYEVSDDLRSGAPSLVISQLREVGVTSATVKQARAVCLDAASDHAAQGLQHLDRKERNIYQAIRKLLDVRYKFVKRLADDYHLAKTIRR